MTLIERLKDARDRVNAAIEALKLPPAEPGAPERAENTMVMVPADELRPVLATLREVLELADNREARLLRRLLDENCGRYVDKGTEDYLDAATRHARSQTAEDECTLSMALVELGVLIGAVDSAIERGRGR